MQDVTASAGVIVTQTVSGDVVTGTLQTALTGANTKIIVVTSGEIFISTTDIVIGTGDTAITIVHATIMDADKITPTDPKTCVSCPAGWTSEKGSTKCQACEAGTFNNEKGKDCQDCSVGQHRSSKNEDGVATDLTRCK